jgi:hypothetical protein
VGEKKILGGWNRPRNPTLSLHHYHMYHLAIE